MRKLDRWSQYRLIVENLTFAGDHIALRPVWSAYIASGPKESSDSIHNKQKNNRFLSS